MNFEYLNQMIQYIEENLNEEIDYNNLAKIVGVSEYSLQRIFIFLTNMSLAEYIRKRRLSRAYEDIKTTNDRIIDIAIKYQYESSISFSRAFKNLFGVSPTECRKTANDYKQFPIIKFKDNVNQSDELNYKIEEIKEKTLFCYEVKADTHDELLYNIRKLYSDLQKNGKYNKLNEMGMYGISVYRNKEYIYYLGGIKNLEGTKKVLVPTGKYAIFKVGSREQKDIVNSLRIIYTQWNKSTNYEMDEDFCFEYYKNDNCYLYMLLKNKQN